MKASDDWEVSGPRTRDTSGGRDEDVGSGESDHNAKTTGT